MKTLKPISVKTIILMPFCFLILCLTQAHAQDFSQKLQWNSSGFTDLNSNSVVNIPCQFVTYGDQKVDWIQSSGSFVTAFTVTGTVGTWTDVSKSGTITFNISMNELSGQLVFTRDADGLKLKVVLTGGTTNINNLYLITSIQVL